MKFQFLLSKAHLESGGKLPLLIISTIILDSLDTFSEERKVSMEKKSLFGVQ